MNLKRYSLMGVLLMALTAAGCGEGSGGTTEPVEQFPRMRGNQVVFYFVPRANHNIQTIVVAGSFGAEGTPQFWNSENQQFAMTRRADGNWELARQLPAGNYEYKFVINGNWVQHMCNDATWGNPAHGNRVDPAVTDCNEDPFGGANARLTVP
jgi:hypothetical protein